MFEMEFEDISEEMPKKKDKFMTFVIISLIVLVVSSLIVYFFGYNLLKGFIKV